MSTRCMIERFGGNGIFVINHYSGCSFGCQYAPCGPPSTPKIARDDIHTSLAHALKSVPPDETIWIGAQVEPYQSLEKELRLTRTILEFFSKHPQKINIITKSDLVFRDIDVLKGVHIGHVFFSLCTLDETWARQFEPHAPTPSERIHAAKQLLNDGIPVGIKIQPYIPTISHIPDILNVFKGYEKQLCFETRPLHLLPEKKDLFQAHFGKTFTQEYILVSYEQTQQLLPKIPITWKPFLPLRNLPVCREKDEENTRASH